MPFLSADEQVFVNGTVSASNNSPWYSMRNSADIASAALYIRVTGITLSPSVVFHIQESVDGINVANDVALAAITAAGTYKLTLANPYAPYVRATWVYGGTGTLTGVFADLLHA